jgi:hypothetical protein
MLNFVTDPEPETEYALTRFRFAANASDEPPTPVEPNVKAPTLTTADCPEDAGAEEPPPFDAVTTTRNVNDTSAACTP